MIERSEVCARIKRALKRKTGIAWSVTGGRGTGWGWITIMSLSARRVNHEERKGVDRYALGIPVHERVNEVPPKPGRVGMYMTRADCIKLQNALKLDRPAHYQGESVESGWWEWYLARAES